MNCFESIRVRCFMNRKLPGFGLALFLSPFFVSFVHPSSRAVESVSRCWSSVSMAAVCLCVAVQYGVVTARRVGSSHRMRPVRRATSPSPAALPSNPQTAGCCCLFMQRLDTCGTKSSQQEAMSGSLHGSDKILRTSDCSSDDRCPPWLPLADRSDRPHRSALSPQMPPLH